MKHVARYLLAFSLAGALAPAALAIPVNVGTITYDLSTPPGAAQFDIINFTGGNASTLPDTTFPVTTPVSLTGLSLTVGFASGPDEIFGSSYFTLAGDHLSFDGTALSTGIGQPSGIAGATHAVLSGSFATTTFLLSDGTSVTVDPNFSATISDSTGLVDGNFGLITANGTPSGGPPVVPEPDTFLLVGTGLAGLAALRRRFLTPSLAKVFGASLSIALLAAIVAAPLAAQTAGSVKLTAWTSPSAGASGSTFVNLNGTGFPPGAINPSQVSVQLSTSCHGPSPATATPSSVKTVVGTNDRVQFQIPALLATGTYFASLSGTSSAGTAFASTNCSEVTVTHTSSALAACLPSSSLAVLSGANVTAYIPKGYWEAGAAGIKVVPVEGSGLPATIATPAAVNSCSSNSQTGETVCVGNNTNIYEITGNSLNATLTSGASASASFSGGFCQNCGVAIDALTNTAVISMGVSGSNSGDGVQLLNLSNNTFAPVFPTNAAVSENVSIDPNRNLILSPGEGGVYDLLKISPTGTLTEYENPVSGAGEFDSAAEDCTTGIALSTIEFTGNLYITDLSQASFTDPAPGAASGTWTAPGQVVNFPEFNSFSAGTDGISVAAGTTHLGIVEGEFGGSTFGVFKLPATAGSGTPAFVDYAAASLPPTPDGNSFSAGYDPHTVTAYTSPSNGKAYGLIADWITGTPTYLAVVDLQALLNAPRDAGTHQVSASYDLLANGVLRYVPAP